MMSTGTTGGSGDDDSLGGDGRKGKSRELSQSKRAAQNRQAQFESQRAFRQRKEGYIKKLEEQVREHHTLEENYKQIQAENYSLREYIIHLQSRLIDNQQEFPEPPPNVNLSNPQQRAEHLHNAQQHHENNGVSVAPVAPMTQLQQAATRSLAVAGLKHPQDERPYEQQQKRFKDSNEESSVADEQLLRSQLQGGSAHGLPISN
ncbi:hypothetical protein B0O99DRAFT_394739 [Bisporella sp. PMI_857]|nr:hypothetical protein B0O99DRAFT_394739 [Bisporella sp. PMI_857]